ncbi:MAG: DUF4858 domain-containing protein [Tannerellaceae bacterium]|jgi:hypothetical protein|nr:DUF4858 domain-containing protein [Tannerellaceae bacterium]
MDKRLILFLFVCVHQTGSLYAQWTEKDSVWLKDVLSGKEQLQLNPETREAIRSGRLINTGAPSMELLAAPPILPISKDFDIQPADTTSGEAVDYSQMPPAVLALYKKELMLRSDTIEKLQKGAFAMPDLRDKDRIQLGKSPISVAVQATNVYNDQIKDGQKRGGVVLGIRLTFSLDDILTGIFSKTERAKRRNKKKANAWKYYNNYPEHLEWKPEEKPGETQ